MLWGEVRWNGGAAGDAADILWSPCARQDGKETDRSSSFSTLLSRAETEELEVLFTGRIYNKEELTAAAQTVKPLSAAALVARLYAKWRQEVFARINGPFGVAVWEKQRGKLLLARDHLGIQPLYYATRPGRLLFSSSLPALFEAEGMEKELNLQTLYTFLLFNYNPGQESFFKGVRKLRSAHLLQADRSSCTIAKYWMPSFGSFLPEEPAAIAEELLGRLREAVRLRDIPLGSKGLFLSGGLDSSTVLALLAEEGTLPRTFSYTCRQKYFDESRYAKSMARQTGTRHHETPFVARDILRMREVVRWMDEPFCDVGINLATHLLGRAARKQGVRYVFTGDGGDELFAGHPVYEADKIARYADRLPGPVKEPLIRLAAFLPDSEKKKSWVVKTKRFAENLRLPSDILTNRWRVLYPFSELRELSADVKALDVFNGSLLEDVTGYGREVEGDPLSRSLYNDYQTVVDFYLRRNDLNKALGVETCYPLLDCRLVDFCARIPPGLKIRKWFETKYILKEAVKEVLPPDILYRKDKLGHSIPLKNWLRNCRSVREFVLDYLSDTANKRGFFKSSVINRMVAEHLSRKRNNSHRLWGLAVLEMWLQENYDRNHESIGNRSAHQSPERQMALEISEEQALS